MPGRVVIFGWADSIHIQRWVRGLSERGWKVRLISLGGGPVPGAETIVLKRHGRLSYYWHAAGAARLAREFKPDLVHVHYAGGFGLWGAGCRFAPLLVSVWGSDIVDLPKNPIHAYFIRRVLRRADYVTATSEFLKRSCVALVPETDPKIAVIPFGVVLPEASAPMPPLPVRLCFIKMHRHKYGPDILLRAFSLVRQEIPDILLTMAGEGEMTSELKSTARGLGLEKVVSFIGMIPNERIYSLLREHHIMVMPSVMESESFGVAVLEAAACGRPTIASRVGGVPEVLREGETGLLVPPGDETALAEAIMRLARDSTGLEAMGRSAYDLVRREYVWKRSLDLMDNLYEKVMRLGPDDPT